MENRKKIYREQDIEIMFGELLNTFMGIMVEENENEADNEPDDEPVCACPICEVERLRDMVGDLTDDYMELQQITKEKDERIEDLIDENNELEEACEALYDENIELVHMLQEKDEMIKDLTSQLKESKFTSAFLLNKLIPVNQRMTTLTGSYPITFKINFNEIE